MVHGKRLLWGCAGLHDMRLEVAWPDVIHQGICLHGLPRIPQRLQRHHLKPQPQYDQQYTLPCAPEVQWTLDRDEMVGVYWDSRGCPKAAAMPRPQDISKADQHEKVRAACGSLASRSGCNAIT